VEINIFSTIKKARMSRSKFKDMLIVFFDIQGTVMTEWVPGNQTVNQQYYIEVLTKLRERVRRKRPELLINGWILHQNNAPAYNASYVKQFLANKNITVLGHPPHSPDLSPCDFYLFPKIIQCSKETILCW
jgi:histone-lysine N-methyltransferase SETMAR